jgi:DNA-binding LacI/PurR family transcriptional regulator
LTVPGDVALFGFDGSERSATTNPPISTISQPIPLLGQEAVLMLLQRIEAPDAPPMHRLLPTELILRASCGCALPNALNEEVAGD